MRFHSHASLIRWTGWTAGLASIEWLRSCQICSDKLNVSGLALLIRFLLIPTRKWAIGLFFMYNSFWIQTDNVHTSLRTQAYFGLSLSQETSDSQKSGLVQVCVYTNFCPISLEIFTLAIMWLLFRVWWWFVSNFVQQLWSRNSAGYWCWYRSISGGHLPSSYSSLFPQVCGLLLCDCSVVLSSSSPPCVVKIWP